MTSMFGELNQFLLGDIGRFIIKKLIQNKIIFLVAFSMYGLLLLYSKMIYMYYLPNKMKSLVLANTNVSMNILVQLWEDEKKKIPSYILIPTKNEMWVRKLNISNGEFDLLYFNRKNNPKDELAMLKQIMEK